MLSSHVKISPFLRLHNKSGLLQQKLKGLVFISVYIINRILHGRFEIRNFSCPVKTYFTRSLRSVVKYCSTRRARCRPHLSTYVWLASLQFDIRDDLFYSQLTAVKSRYPLTSTTWPYGGLRLELIEVKCFLKLTANQVLDFHLIAGSSIFTNYENKHKNRAPHLGVLNLSINQSFI